MVLAGIVTTGSCGVRSGAATGMFCAQQVPGFNSTIFTSKHSVQTDGSISLTVLKSKPHDGMAGLAVATCGSEPMTAKPQVGGSMKFQKGTKSIALTHGLHSANWQGRAISLKGADEAHSVRR